MIHVAILIIAFVPAEITLRGVDKGQPIVFRGHVTADGFVIGHLKIGKVEASAFGVVHKGRVYVEDRRGWAVLGDVMGNCWRKR